jgi:hypothetical protein
VEIALHGWMRKQKPVSTTTEHFNSRQEGMNASLCSRIMMKNNDTSAKKVSNIQLCNFFLFDFYDPGNLTY